jgi:hypothetical protein
MIDPIGTKQVWFRMDPRRYEDLVVEAMYRGLTVSALVRQLVEDCLNERAERERALGLPDIDITR